jgi:hypothetical protein
MKKTPVTSCISLSIDLMRDRGGTVPPAMVVAWTQVRTTRCRAGLGFRPLWMCPECRRPVLILYVNPFVRVACRKCHPIAYTGSFLRRTPLEKHAADLRKGFA